MCGVVEEQSWFGGVVCGEVWCGRGAELVWWSCVWCGVVEEPSWFGGAVCGVVW